MKAYLDQYESFRFLLISQRIKMQEKGLKVDTEKPAIQKHINNIV